MFIDMKNDREALGLPGNNKTLSPFFKLLAAAMIVSLLAALAGYATQYISGYANMIRLSKLTAEYDLAVTPQEQASLAMQIKEITPDTALGHFIAGNYLAVTANTQPYYRTWEAAALHEYQLAFQLPYQQPPRLPSFSEDTNEETVELNKKQSTEIFRFDLTLSISGLLLEQGKAKEALDLVKPLSVGTLNAFHPLVDQQKNLIAYILSSTTNPKIRDGKRALQIIRNVVRRQGYARIPAYMDTLAESYYACNEPAKAVQMQKWALAIAHEPIAWVYIEHYQKYLAAAEKSAEPPEQSD